MLDPRLVWHLAKVARFYAYTHVEPRHRIAAGPGLRMAPTASLRNGERIVLGSGVRVGEGCFLWAGDATGRIRIGDDVLLAPGVFITASNYATVAGRRIDDRSTREADVVVGDDVWLGARAVVLPGVRIGDGAVVGAGAVVTKDLPPNAVAVGVPARVVAWRDGAAPAGTVSL